MGQRFEDLLQEFGKPLDELTDEEITLMCSKLNSQELERFEAVAVKQQKTSKTRKPSKAGASALDAFDQIMLGVKQ